MCTRCDLAMFEVAESNILRLISSSSYVIGCWIKPVCLETAFCASVLCSAVEIFNCRLQVIGLI